MCVCVYIYIYIYIIQIMIYPDPEKLLNQRCELIARCRHMNKFNL